MGHHSFLTLSVSAFFHLKNKEKNDIFCSTVGNLNRDNIIKHLGFSTVFEKYPFPSPLIFHFINGQIPFEMLADQISTVLLSLSYLLTLFLSLPTSPSCISWPFSSRGQGLCPSPWPGPSLCSLSVMPPLASFSAGRSLQDSKAAWDCSLPTPTLPAHLLDVWPRNCGRSEGITGVMTWGSLPSPPSTFFLPRAEPIRLGPLSPRRLLWLHNSSTKPRRGAHPFSTLPHNLFLSSPFGPPPKHRKGSLCG